MIFELIKAEEADKAYLLKLRKLTMLEHLERSGQFLSEEEHGQRINHKFECSYLIFHNKELVGMVKYLSSTNELELIQIQLDPKYQGKGFGTGIVEQIINNEQNKTVKLAVLKDNPVLELYKRLGFEIVGEDDHEYHMQKNC